MTYLDTNYYDVLPPATKWSFTARRVNRSDVDRLTPVHNGARAGDLVLCEILEINQHKKLQLAEQRYAQSYIGDHVVVVVGDRYAPDQFMGRAEVNEHQIDLLAGGGIAGTVEARHALMSKPTQLRPLGLLTDSYGAIINVADYALPSATIPDHVTVLGVFGASMNAGKTTAAVSLAHGLLKAGHKVAGVKATGTGAFGDFNAFEDALVPVTDFTDAGMPTTFRMPISRIEHGFETLVGTAAANGAEIVVVEIADGVFQRETEEILRDSNIIRRMDGIMFAAPDALGAVGGTSVLARHGLTPFAISGMVSLSALGTKEAMAETALPVLTREELCTGHIVEALVSPLLRRASDDAIAA